MCGRFFQTLSFEILRDYFHLNEGVALPPRYNIAPSLDVAAVRQKEDKRRLVALHWGLIPFWTKDRKIGYKTLTARSETAPIKLGQPLVSRKDAKNCKTFFQGLLCVFAA